MCGIAGIGIFNKRNEVKIDYVNKVTEIMKHRGPDDSGFWLNEDKNVCLIHRRLSIIDLQSGNQPMTDYRKKNIITYNGEIYNFLEIQKELINQGHKFLTKSDTEVILSLYLESGISNFSKLNGIFAFAIFDKYENTLILARDRFGVKPLYYYIDSEKIIFGSELKTILVYPGLKKEFDYSGFGDFLYYRYNPSPNTLFKYIKKLNPGYCLKVNLETGKISKHDFCSENIPRTKKFTYAEVIEKYQYHLEKAVTNQLVSDVPVGLMLSGGMDSAIIGKIAQENYSQKLKTFTIGFEGQGDFNELNDARKTANYIGSEHYDVLINQKDYLDFFYKSFFFLEEPISETTIPALYYLSKLAASHVKVVLAGQGADEPLAGYHRYLGIKYLPVIKKYGLKNIVALLKRVSRNERIRRSYDVLWSNDEFSWINSSYALFNEDMLKNLVKEDVLRLLDNQDRFKTVKLLYQKGNFLDDAISKMMFIDTRMNLADDLLLFGDKMSMANSLEMRVPFLDNNLIDFLETVPSKFKINRGVRKWIHKKAAIKWIPSEIINRKKRGFNTPMDTWLQNGMYNIAYDLFNQKGSACSEFFNIININRILSDHKNKKQNLRRQIFALFSFEIWYNNFYKAY